VKRFFPLSLVQAQPSAAMGQSASGSVQPIIFPSPRIGTQTDASTLIPIREVAVPNSRKKRLERNRQAAKECRRRKKVYMKELESRVQKLQQENNLLKNELRAALDKLSEVTGEKVKSSASLDLTSSKVQLSEVVSPVSDESNSSQPNSDTQNAFNEMDDILQFLRPQDK
jgi:hypothetical protein